MSSIVSLIHTVVDTVLTKHEISDADLITAEILVGLGLDAKPKKKYLDSEFKTIETYIPKTSTQIKTYRNLLDILTRDGGELIGKYKKITTDSLLVLRCKCGNKFNKKLKQLNITGAFCHPCMYKSASKKRETTLLAEKGVTNISCLQSTKENK